MTTKENTKNNLKDTITKDNSNLAIAVTGDAVNRLFNIFHQINPALNYGNITQRKAAQWLIDKFGEEKALKLTEYAISIQGELYAPQVFNPLQLKDKCAAIAMYKHKQDKSIKQRNVREEL